MYHKPITLPVFVAALLFLVISVNTMSAQKKKILTGFDGGMMVHSGYLKGTMGPEKIPAEGLPFGLGGVLRVHLGKHIRIGGEGYVSTLNQRGNGSYVRYGWGGLLADAYTVIGRFQPFAGITLGGGAGTTLMMEQTPASAWEHRDGTVFNKQGFMALDPFVGCDFILGGPMHLTLKVDWLNCLGKDVTLPGGPRVYLGILFYR